MPVRYFVHVGNEKIELGQDKAKKEDPFKPVQTSAPISHYSVTLTDERGNASYTGIATDSLKDAVKHLRKQIPDAELAKQLPKEK
jgi:hypothetical protein